MRKRKTLNITLSDRSMEWVVFMSEKYNVPKSRVVDAALLISIKYFEKGERNESSDGKQFRERGNT